MAKASPVVGHHGQDSEPEVKNVQIFSNGDRFAPGRHVVLNTRQIRNFETFLDELTRILNPLHGAIRRLYTPVNGTPVEDTKDLREGAGYVAAGKEKFKKLSYYEIQPLSPRRGKGPKFPYFDIKPVTHSQFRVSGKVKKINIQNKKIVVFPNGQFFLPPSIIVLNQNDQASMDTVMHSVGIKVDLPQGGFPERLYTLDGLRVDSTEKVTNGTMYVAASHREKFKPGPYGPYMRMGQVKSRKSRATTRDTENGVFHVRPVKHKRSPEKPAVRQTVDYDKDVGGLFRSKNPLFDHAEVIDEMNKAEETVAEPIDHGSSLEEDKSKNDYTGVAKDPLISVPDNIPPVSAEGTNVDEEPVFKEGSSKPAKGPTPEKAEIQVPTPEPKDDVAASPKEEARPIETAKTEEAPIKEEMNHPSIEVMNKSTRDKISESFPGQISSEQLNDFPKDQLNELNNNVQYDKPVSEPCKEIPKEQFSELSKERFNESPNGHFSEQLKEGFGEISVQPQDPEVNIPKVDSSKHQQQENLSDKQLKVDVKEQGKEQQVDKSLSDKYKDEELFSKQSKKESPHQSSGALHDQGSQQICDQVQPMGVDSSPRIISNDKVHQLSTDSQPKEKTDDQSKVENNEQSEAQNAKELSKPTQMPFTDQTIETKNKPSQPQLNEPLSQAEFNDSQNGKINETSSHSLFSEKDQGNMAMHHQAETPKETFGKMNESFSKIQDTGKPEEKINEPAQSQFGEKTNEKNNEKPQTDIMKQSNEKIGTSTEPHFTDQNNKKDSGLSHSQFDKKPDEKMSETSSESQFSEQAHVMMNEPQSKPFEQPQETLREALPSQFTEPFSPSPFSEKHKDLSEPSSKSQCDEPPREKMSESLPQTHMAQTDEKTCKPSSQSEIPEQHNEKIDKPLSKSQFSEPPKEMSEHSNSLSNEKSQGKGNEPASQSHFSDQSSKDVCETTSQSLFTDKTDELSSPSQFGVQAHDKMNEPSSQSQIVEQPHEKMIEPQSKLGQQTHENMSEPSSQSHFGEQPHEKMSEPSSQSQFSEQPHDKMSEPSSQNQFSDQPHDKMSETSSQSQFSEQPHEKMSEPSSQSHFGEQPHEKMSEPSSQNQFSDQPHDKMGEPSSQSQFSEQPHDKMGEPSSQSQFSDQPHDKMSEPSSQSQFSEQPHDKMSEPSSQTQFSDQPHDKMSEPSSQSQSQFSEQPHDKMSEPSSQSQSQFSEQSYGNMNEPSSQSQFNEKQSHDKISEPPSQSHFSEKPNDQMSEPFSQSQFNEQPHEKMSEPLSQSQFSEPTHEKMSEPSSQSQFTRQLNDKIYEPSSQSQISEPPHEKISESSSVSQFDKQTHEKANELPSQIQYSEHSHDKDHTKFPTDLNENSQNFGKEFHEEVGQQQQQPYSQFNDPFNQISKLTQDQSHENSQTIFGQKQQFTDKPCEKVMDQYEAQFPDSSKQKIGGQHEEPANNHLQQTQFNDQLTQLKEQVTQQPQVLEKVSQLPMNTYEELHKVSDLPQQDEFNKKSSGQFSDDHYQQDMGHVPEYAYQSVETPKQQSRESSPHPFSDASYDLVGDKSPLHFTDQTQNNFGQETLKQSTEEHFVQESKQQFEEPLPHNFCDKNIEKLSDQVQQQFKGIDEQLIGKENHEQTTQQSFAAFIDQPTEVINNKVHQLFSEQVIEENDVHQSHGIMVEQSKVPNNGQSQLENKNEFGNFDKDSISEQNMMTLQETAEKSNEKLKDIGMATPYDQFERSSELKDDKKAVVEDLCDFSKVQTTECLRDGQRKEIIVGQPDMSNNKDKQDAFESFPMKDTLSKEEDTNKEKVNEFNQIENNNNDVKISSADLFASEIGKEVKEMVSDHSKTAGLNGLEKNDYHEMAKEVVLESQEQKNLKAAKESFDVNGLPKDNVKESSSQAIMPEQVHVMGKGDTALHESLMQSKEKDNKLEIASKDVKMSGKDESPKMDSDTTNEGKVNEKNEKSQQDDHLAEKETDKNGHQKDSVREQPNVPVTDKTQQH